MRMDAYLFCKYLEQNGLYDTDVADEGYHYDWSEPPSYRECSKVYARSGARKLLSQGHPPRNQLVNRLEESGCITREAGECALATGHWRRRQAEAFGYDTMYLEGGCSVPSTYTPSRNLASETYETYRNGGATKDAVVDRVVSTTAPNRSVEKADRVFDVVSEIHVPRRTLFRTLHANDRFPSGVASVQLYVVMLGANERIERPVVESALGETWSEIERSWGTVFDN